MDSTEKMSKMDNAQAKQLIIELFNSIQITSFKHKKALFMKLKDLIDLDVSDAVLKEICLCLRLTLPRYHDAKSRKLVQNFIQTMLQRHKGSSVHLLKIIGKTSQEYGNGTATKSLSKINMVAFKWSCLLSTELVKNGCDLKDLIKIQSTLLMSLTSPGWKRLNQSALKKMSTVWSTSEVLQKYTDTTSALTKTEPTLPLMMMWSFLFTRLNAHKISPAELKPLVLETFAKLILGSKTKVPVNILEHSKPFLRHVTHDDFSKLLLPGMQKSLLRNPEIILESVGMIINNVSIDLSQYALELGKSLGTHLSSKDDLCREEAIKAFLHLGQQCSSPEPLEDLLNYIFGILNGSNGKLTVVTQRMGVLSGLGNLSFHAVSGSSLQHSLNEVAVKHFISVLKQEIHEGTVIHAIKMLSLWAAKLTKVPSSLIECFKTGMAQKTATPLVRVAYLECMSSAFRGNCLLQGLDVIPELSKALERALAQSAQINVVAEGLVSALVLLRLDSSDITARQKVRSEVAILVEVQRLPFFTEKFLNSASQNTLLYVPQVVENIILGSYPIPDNKILPALKAMIYCLNHPSCSVRAKAKTSTIKLVSSQGGWELSSFLLHEFVTFASTSPMVNEENKIKDDPESYPHNYAHTMSESLKIICLGDGVDIKDSKLLAMKSFLPSNLSVIFSSSPNLWRYLLKHIHLDPVEFSVQNKDDLLRMTLLEDDITPIIANALGSLVILNPNQFVPSIIDHVKSLLKEPALLQITLEEFLIFQTPPGMLYNASIIDNLKDDTGNNKNLKRESKLYSYKEQMEEIELRKEMEAKKRAKGVIKEPELTKKQIEAKKVQLEKEAGIRNHINKLDKQLKKALTIISHLINSNNNNLKPYVGRLVDLLLPLAKSPLCAADSSEVFLELVKCAFKKPDEIFGTAVGYSILRLIEPECKLNESWLQEDLNAMVQRVITGLASKTLSTAGFAYSFPLLSLLLTKCRFGESIIIQCLELILKQVSITNVDEEIAINMPTTCMLATLVQVLTENSGKVEQLAKEVLLKVSEGIRDGLGNASMSEFKVLLLALQCSKNEVRKSALESLIHLSDVLPNLDDNYEDGLLILRRVCVTKYDCIEENKVLAENLWDKTRLTLNPSLCELLLSDVTHPEKIVRDSAAEALASVVVAYPDSATTVLNKLMLAYKEKLILPAQVVDIFGRVAMEAPPDDWEPREGIALAINKLGSYLNEETVSDLISFFVPEALGDRHQVVRKAMLDAATNIVELHWSTSINCFLPVFEDFLDKAPDSGSHDAVRQSVVILLGTVARHLDKGDPKIKPIVAKLIESLSTPSEQVQEAVANCLPPLVPAIKEEAPVLVKKLLQLLLEAENYGERRGAAYGLAGLIKGLGILSLKQLEIMNLLTEAIQDKKNARHREGALFALEMLCTMLGRLFEPYIVHILPHLLLCFGDSNQYVREATDNTAKAVMSKLSAHGVKLVLPSLLIALEEDSWRTKAGSVELLGAMAYCAPKQLSSCLPNIVPKLIEVLSDSHIKVQKAGAQALKQIGSVIRNPEIQAIVPQLLEALQDPSAKTSSCLSVLLETRFIHFIDAPSLALIMPVVERSFQDRTTWTRKMAAQIIGNMYSLTDQKDLSPYLPTILPGLKQSLLDPVPDVRSVSARALGALVKGMGESSFDDLLPWLMQTLTSESSPVDRSGAAQGLSEVMGSLGVEKLHKHMPDIISTAERLDIAPHVKDGYIMMFIYLPVVFTKEFTPYIGQIINPILKALADENEYVRETALKAGQRIVNMYAESAITLLLPELEKGLFDINWRIRYSSIQLLGDLLYKISGVSGKMTTETASEDDNFGTEQSHKAIIHLLGVERRNRVLAGLYMGRSDVALMVRQAALHVWKVVVTNTPKTLREILQTLFSLLLGCLASPSYDKRQVAARTLGDLVRKLGERVLPEIIPILERGLKSERADQRQGVCIGLSEIMSSTSREMVLNFVDSLVPTIKLALCDPLPEVREAAAKTFDSLHQTVGVRALDDIIPPLLKQLSNPELAEYTLDGLRQVMAIKSKVVLPYLVPQLTTPPVNTKALSLLSTVAGDALTKHLGKILPALLLSLSSAFGSSTETQELEYCQAVVLAVTDDVGVRTIIDYLLDASKLEALPYRQAAVALLCAFCSHSKASFSQYVPQLLRGLVHLFTETDPTLLKLSWESLNSVIKTLDPAEQQQHVADIRQAVRFAVSDLKGQKYLPGFCLPKGISPILPVFRDAILNGSPELKEQAAQGLGEVILLTSAEALKPSVVHITGPLIRILGDRFSWNIKLAILETLALLLERVGAMLKPFLPQLQTTFLKALGDAHKLVRLKAATALSHLIVIHTRCDPLFTELHNAAKNTEDVTIKETMLHALRCVITPAGDKMSDPVRKSIYATLMSLISSQDDSCRMVTAGCLGALVKWLPEEELYTMMNENLLDDDPSLDWIIRHGKSLTLMITLKEVAPDVLKPEWSDRIIKTLTSYMTADRLPLVLSGIRGTGYFLFHALQSQALVPQPLLTTFAKNMNHHSSEVKQVVALTCNFLGKRVKTPFPPHFVKSVVPLLVNGTKEKNTVVKANSEYALVSLLRMRTADDSQQIFLTILESGAKDALQDVIHKVLRKVAAQPEPKEEELDDTLLS